MKRGIDHPVKIDEIYLSLNDCICPGGDVNLTRVVHMIVCGFIYTTLVKWFFAYYLCEIECFGFGHLAQN